MDARGPVQQPHVLRGLVRRLHRGDLAHPLAAAVFHRSSGEESLLVLVPNAHLIFHRSHGHVRTAIGAYAVGMHGGRGARVLLRLQLARHGGELEDEALDALVAHILRQTTCAGRSKPRGMSPT